MMCRHCYREIVQKDFEKRCSFNECHDLVDSKKWWDDQLRCKGLCGWHHFNIKGPRDGEYVSYGPHQPHTRLGRPIYPVYVTDVGEEVLGIWEENGCTVYRDQWRKPGGLYGCKRHL